MEMIEKNDAATHSVAAENENLAMKVSPQAQIHECHAERSGGTLFRVEDSGLGGRAAAARCRNRSIDRDIDRIRAALERGAEKHGDMKRVTERRGDDLREGGA